MHYLGRLGGRDVLHINRSYSVDSSYCLVLHGTDLSQLFPFFEALSS